MNTDKSADVLLPCPFCGNTPRIETRDVEPQGDPWYGGRDETFVLCDCGACLFDGNFHEGFYDAETRAVEAWNRRATAPQTGVIAAGLIEQHHRDSAALRRLCAERDQMLSDERIGKFVAEIFGEDRFRSAPGKYQLFARAIEQAVRDEAFKQGYAKGWAQCAKWADRVDLIADIDSTAYIHDLNATIKSQRETS